VRDAFRVPRLLLVFMPFLSIKPVNRDS